MTKDQIEQAVTAFREKHSGGAHAAINATAFRHQTPEFIAAQMAPVEALVESYRKSLGAPDAQSIAQGDEPPAPAVVTPGTKG